MSLRQFCTFLRNEARTCFAHGFHLITTCMWYCHSYSWGISVGFTLNAINSCLEKTEAPPVQRGIHSSLALPCQSQQMLTSNDSRDGPLKLKRSCFSFDGTKEEESVCRKLQREIIQPRLQAGRMVCATAVWIGAIWTTFLKLKKSLLQ